MTQYDNTNRGVLFKNDRKDKDTHPDYRGNIKVDGQEYWLSAWIKAGKSGKFMSISIKPKEELGAIRQQAMAKVYPKDRITSGKQNILPDDMDGDAIPF